MKRSRSGTWSTSEATTPRAISSEYWIVNLQTETITVLQLHEDAYQEAGAYRRGESAASKLLPDFSVPVAAVFDAD